MSRVLTFSRHFPAYHPKAGQPTYFVDSIWGCLYNHGVDLSQYISDPDMYMRNNWFDKSQKLHTIRAGHRWKVGDKFSPRVWSGKPYRSQQIIIAPDMEVKKVWDFSVGGNGILLGVPGETPECWKRAFIFDTLPTRDWPFETLYKIAENDGLSLNDFLAWFKYPAPFDGQIICWDDSVNY